MTIESRKKSKNVAQANIDESSRSVTIEGGGNPRVVTVEESALSTNNTADEVAQLRELTETLLHAVGALQVQNQRTAVVSGLVEDVRAATRSMVLSAPLGAPYPHRDTTESCACGPCDCVSSDCCTFEIEMTHARAIEMQIEPFDSNVNPFAEMEIRIFASIDGIGAIIPNMFSTINLRKNISKPGLWVQVKRRVGVVTVCKGKPKHLTIDVDAVEVDDGGVEALGVRDEHGSGSGTMVLDCCLPVPATTSIEVHLDHNGLGGGAIEVKLVATKISC